MYDTKLFSKISDESLFCVLKRQKMTYLKKFVVNPLFLCVEAINPSTDENDVDSTNKFYIC